MHAYIIIFAFLVFGYAYSTDLSDPVEIGNDSGCLTDELYGDFTDVEFNNLIKRRKNVKIKMESKLNRNPEDTLSIKVIFHDVFRKVTDKVDSSFCHYNGGFNAEITYSETGLT